MPYNTRRKSLSLPSLGIHVPVTHAARAAAAAAVAAAATKPNTPNTVASPVSSSSPNKSNTSSSSNTSSAASGQQRQLTPASDSSTNMAPPASTSSLSSSPKRTSSSDAQQPSSKRTKRNHDALAAAVATPPQSPKRQASVEMDEEVEIDMDEVNDDIVEAVILQLKSTGNRPHLIKELSAILMTQLKSVQQSANPCAIISSRLASYMKRTCWSASKACPLTKELENIHPRRTYYFLTTCPHLPVPDASSVHFIVPRTSIVTPPLSSAASGSEAAEEERRRELSPSPEVDLSSPEFDDLDDDLPMPGTPITHISHRYPRYSRFARYAHSGHHRSSSSYSSRGHRGASPPLEKDEKEFTQTAEGLQKQKHAGSRFQLSPIAAEAAPPSDAAVAVLLLDETANRDDSLMFGSSTARNFEQHFTLMTSPAMRPMFSLGPKRDHEAENWAKLDSMVNDWDRCPEHVELEELDGLLDEF